MSETVVRRWARNRMIMGLPFSVHLRGEFDDADAEATVQQMWDELAEVDRIFSTYRSDSDISRIERGSLTVARAHPDVRAVLEIGEQARLVTSGAFDVRAGATLDPSGVVKGWAAERAAGRLRRLGADFYLNAGGDIVARALDSATPWVLGVESPAEQGKLLAVVTIADGALATSGTVHRGAHILDPATGQLADRVRQVSVLGPSLTWTDIWATAAAVAGPAIAPAATGHEMVFVLADGRVGATTGFACQLAAGHARPDVDFTC